MKNFLPLKIDIFLSVSVTSLVIFLDRVTKRFFTKLLDYGESIKVIPHALDFTLIHNTGIAFGLFKDKGYVFIIIPIIAVILLVVNIYYYRKSDDALSHTYIVAIALILGGAIGNLIDRIMYGYVIDFINFHIWPVFNVADSAITIGAIVIGIKCIRLSAK